MNAATSQQGMHGRENPRAAGPADSIQQSIPSFLELTRSLRAGRYLEALGYSQESVIPEAKGISQVADQCRKVLEAELLRDGSAYSPKTFAADRQMISECERKLCRRQEILDMAEKGSLPQNTIIAALKSEINGLEVSGAPDKQLRGALVWLLSIETSGSSDVFSGVALPTAQKSALNPAQASDIILTAAFKQVAATYMNPGNRGEAKLGITPPKLVYDAPEEKLERLAEVKERSEFIRRLRDEIMRRGLPCDGRDMKTVDAVAAKLRMVEGTYVKDCVLFSAEMAWDRAKQNLFGMREEAKKAWSASELRPKAKDSLELWRQKCNRLIGNTVNAANNDENLAGIRPLAEKQFSSWLGSGEPSVALEAKLKGRLSAFESRLEKEMTRARQGLDRVIEYGKSTALNAPASAQAKRARWWSLSRWF